MLVTVLVAIGIALRPRRFWEPLALGAAALLPWWMGMAAIGIAMLIVRRTRRPDPYQEVAYLQAVSAELQAGRSLRHALVEATVRAPGLDLKRVIRLARSGRPMDEVAVVACDSLPGTGRLAAAAMRIGAGSGGRVASAFATLSAIQADRIDMARETRAAGATARASVVVLSVVPIGGIGLAVATGSLFELMDMGRIGPILVAAGSLLLVTGAVVTLLLGRSLS